MSTRTVVHIDEEKCVGCGLCIPKCQEGALKIIDGKARLSSEAMCDGLGKCLGSCPMDAITLIEKKANEFSNRKMRTADDKPKVQTHLKKEARSMEKSGCGCPGNKMMNFDEPLKTDSESTVSGEDIEFRILPQLRQWPVQLSLVPINAPYFQNADLLVTADCVPFAYPEYHHRLLKGKAVVIGCPKLDNKNSTIQKLTDIFSNNELNSITVAHMEVPCCNGIVWAVEEALALSGKNIPLNKVEISVKGEMK